MMAPSGNGENPFHVASERGHDSWPAVNTSSTFPGNRYSLGQYYVSSSNNNGLNPSGGGLQSGLIPGQVIRVKPGSGFEYPGDVSRSTTMTSSSANPTDEPKVVIRGEEIGIVIMVLLLWLGAIVLFFHRWGKIRMLEPYQPKFMESHRLSCPMADVTGLPHGPRTYSKFNLSNEIGASPHFAKCNYHGVGVLGGSGGIGAIGSGPSAIAQQILTSANRPRQNSVFVTSPLSTVAVCGSNLKSTSRKTKSAIDLSTLVLSEGFLENVRRSSKNSITQL